MAKGGTLSNLAKVDATHYTATFTPSAGIQIADAKVSVAAATYTDAAGNAGAAASSSNFAVDTKATGVDTTAPTASISISDTALKLWETATATFTFSEAPVGFTLADVSAKGGTLSNLTKVDATHYTAKFSPTAGIEIADAKISVAAASYTDAAGNAGASATSSSFVVDTNDWRGFSKLSWGRRGFVFVRRHAVAEDTQQARHFYNQPNGRVAKFTRHGDRGRNCGAPGRRSRPRRKGRGGQSL